MPAAQEAVLGVPPEPFTLGGLAIAIWGLACGLVAWVVGLLPPLFAEGEWRDVFLFLSPAVAAVATWALMEWRKSRELSRANKRQDDETIIAYYRDLVDRKNKDLLDADKERLAAEAVTEQQRDVARQERERRARAMEKLARYEVYAEFLEERLDAKGEVYRKWRDTPLTQPPSDEPPPKPTNGSGVFKIPPPDVGGQP